jgi:hypothetical protein
MTLPFALSLIFAALMVGLLVGAGATWMSLRKPQVDLGPVIGREFGAAPASPQEPTPQMMARMQELTQRYERQIEVMRKAHDIEKSTLEEELRLTREKLERIILAGEKGQNISSNAFVPTQFDETPAPTPVSKSGKTFSFATTQFDERAQAR